MRLLFCLLLVVGLCGVVSAEESNMVHVVKDYAGDGYWRQTIKFYGPKEYISRYGKDEYEKLMRGEKTNKEIIESSNKKGDYFFDKDGAQWVAQ